MAISEAKMRIVIDNYFKSECNIDTNIRQAFEKGVRKGVQKTISAEQKKGTWTSSQGLAEVGEVKCSSCDTVFYVGDLYDVGETVNGVGQAALPNFCPHCGADMRGENNGK